jgi:hypothetical protein
MPAEPLADPDLAPPQAILWDHAEPASGADATEPSSSEDRSPEPLPTSKAATEQPTLFLTLLYHLAG